MTRSILVSPHKLTLEMARACLDTPQLATAANVSRETIARIYRANGSPVKVSCKTAGKLAKGLGVDVLAIIEN